MAGQSGTATQNKLQTIIQNVGPFLMSSWTKTPQYYHQSKESELSLPHSMVPLPKRGHLLLGATIQLLIPMHSRPGLGWVAKISGQNLRFPVTEIWGILADRSIPTFLFWLHRMTGMCPESDAPKLIKLQCEWGQPWLTSGSWDIPHLCTGPKGVYGHQPAAVSLQHGTAAVTCRRQGPDSPLKKPRQGGAIWQQMMAFWG